MGLNSESPYVGDKAVEEMAGISSPNVLRAVEVAPRPDPNAPLVEADQSEKSTQISDIAE